MHPETQAVSAQRFNALQHGLYAASILLPGEDAAAFRRERRALFHDYLPQTQDEADLVDAMAEHRWLLRRYRVLQARVDVQALTVVEDAAGRIAEPDTHRRLHSGMDVFVHRQRVARLWDRARTKLLEVQKLRRQGLIAGARQFPADCYLDSDGQVYGPIARPAIVPIPEPEIEADSGGATDSADGTIGKSPEQHPAVVHGVGIKRGA